LFTTFYSIIYLAFPCEIANSDFNEIWCTCSLHKEMNLKKSQLQPKQFKGKWNHPLCVKRYKFSFFHRFSKTVTDKKMFYIKVLRKLAIFICVDNIFKKWLFFKVFKNKFFNKYSKKISLTSSNKGNFTVKLLYDIFFYIFNSFEVQRKKLNITLIYQMISLLHFLAATDIF